MTRDSKEIVGALPIDRMLVANVKGVLFFASEKNAKLRTGKLFSRTENQEIPTWHS